MEQSLLCFLYNTMAESLLSVLARVTEIITTHFVQNLTAGQAGMLNKPMLQQRAPGPLCMVQLADVVCKILTTHP